MTHHCPSHRLSGRRSAAGTKGRWTAAALALLVAWGPACGDFDAGFEDMAPEQNEAEGPPLSQAEQALTNHRVDEARQHYADYLESFPEHGTAAAGLALTNLMLLLDLDEVGELLIEYLGASQTLNANEVLFAEGGYLYWASRGARWQDDGEYRGIASLLEDDLPWPADRLETLTTFVEGLDKPAQEGIRHLVWIAEALSSIDQNLARAIDDPNFQRIYIPGEVFHSSELSLQLGRSELSMIRSLLALVRGTIYFVAAYEHDWSLEMAFGTWRHDPDLTHPYYESGYEPVDYTMAYFDDHLFRRLANPNRLAAAQSTLKRAAAYGRQAIIFGVEEPSSTTLRWDRIAEADAEAAADVLAALEKSFEEPTAIPHSAPAVTLDLRPLFGEGRVLAEEIPWFERDDTPARDADGTETDGPRGLARWSMHPEAKRAFFYTDIVDPVPADLSWTIELGTYDSPTDMVDELVGDYRDRLDNIFNTTR